MRAVTSVLIQKTSRSKILILENKYCFSAISNTLATDAKVPYSKVPVPAVLLKVLLTIEQTINSNIMKHSIN